MPQPTYTAIRAALASTLSTAIPGLRGTTDFLQPNPPCAIVIPIRNGTFVTYSVTMDGQVDYHCDILIGVSPADSQAGQDALDSYIATTGPNSVWAAIEANQTLGGIVSWAKVIEGTGYGIVNLSGVDLLAAHLICEIGV